MQAAEETRRTMHHARVGKDLVSRVTDTLRSAARFGKPSQTIETATFEEIEVLYCRDWLVFEGYEVVLETGRLRVIWAY